MLTLSVIWIHCIHTHSLLSLKDENFGCLLSYTYFIFFQRELVYGLLLFLTVNILYVTDVFLRIQAHRPKAFFVSRHFFFSAEALEGMWPSPLPRSCLFFAFLFPMVHLFACYWEEQTITLIFPFNYNQQTFFFLFYLSWAYRVSFPPALSSHMRLPCFFFSNYTLLLNFTAHKPTLSTYSWHFLFSSILMDTNAHNPVPLICITFTFLLFINIIVPKWLYFLRIYKLLFSLISRNTNRENSIPSSEPS